MSASFLATTEVLDVLEARQRVEAQMAAAIAREGLSPQEAEHYAIACTTTRMLMTLLNERNMLLKRLPGARP